MSYDPHYSYAGGQDDAEIFAKPPKQGGEFMKTLFTMALTAAAVAVAIWFLYIEDLNKKHAAEVQDLKKQVSNANIAQDSAKSALAALEKQASDASGAVEDAVNGLEKQLEEKVGAIAALKEEVTSKSALLKEAQGTLESLKGDYARVNEMFEAEKGKAAKLLEELNTLKNAAVDNVSDAIEKVTEDDAVKATTDLINEVGETSQ